LEIREGKTPNAIALAVAIDEAVIGSSKRADYIASVAENGGLKVALLRGEAQAFCCIDHTYFFDKPFVSLLIVAPEARRCGLGAALLTHCASRFPEIWTSTNQSNNAMRTLLDMLGWRYCGELSGLDEGDPERFYRTV